MSPHTDDRLVRSIMLPILVAAVNLGGVGAGYLWAMGDTLSAILSEGIAVLAAGLVLSETRPRYIYAWPPRSSPWLPPPPPPVDLEAHPCRQLLSAMEHMLREPSPANIAQLRQLIPECDEQAMVATARSILISYDLEEEGSDE